MGKQLDNTTAIQSRGMEYLVEHGKVMSVWLAFFSKSSAMRSTNKLQIEGNASLPFNKAAVRT
jgi:hypothetical protein